MEKKGNLSKEINTVTDKAKFQHFELSNFSLTLSMPGDKE